MPEDATLTQLAHDRLDAPASAPSRTSHAALLRLGAAVSALALDAPCDIAIYATAPSRGHVFIYANAACSQHYGVPRESLIGRSIADFIPGVDPGHLDTTMGLMKERGSLTFNSQVLRNGQRVAVVVSLRVVEIDGEDLCVGFARDRDRSYEDDTARLLEIERTVADRLEQAVAAVPGFMFTYTLGDNGVSRFLYASPRIKDLLGFTPEDLCTTLRPYVDRIVPEDVPLIRQQAERMASGTPLQAEFRYNHPTRGLRWLQVTSQRASAIGAPPIDHGFMIDVTDRKLAQHALAHSELHYRQIFENTAEAMFVKDVLENGEIRIVAANRGCEIDTARPRSDIHGKTVFELYSAETAAEIDRWDRMCVAQRRTIEYEGALTFSRGERIFRTRLVPMLDQNSRVHRILGFSLDITEERRAERERHERYVEFQTLVENSPDIIVRYDTELRRTYVNRAFVAATGLPASSVVGKSTHEISPMDAETVRVFQGYLRQVLDGTASSSQLEISFVGVDGRKRLRSIRGVVERDIAGNITGIMTIDRDMTDRIEAERMLAAREREVRTLVDNSPDFIARYDACGNRIYANPAFKRLHNRIQAGAAVIPQEDSERFFTLVQEVIATGMPREIEIVQLTGADGREWAHIQIVPEFDEAGAVISVLSIGRDMTEKVEYRHRMQHAAFFDSLTGLPNRAMLGETSGKWIGRAQDEAFSFAVMVLDLDRFKEVNDGLGHDAGDMLLKSVALRLQACVDDGDIVVRLGGDEFALMVEDKDAVRTDRLARSILTALADPIVLDQKEIFVSASIGIARYSADGTDIETLLRHADAAMYQAKSAGRNNFQYCSPDIAARAVERMTLTSSLRRAISRGEFELHYQPQITLSTGRLSGVEALLRWRHPEHGLVMPDRFIPIAEETGLIVDIGRWVITQACRDIVAWNTLSTEPLRMSVNLSARQFVMNDLVGSIEEILKETGCDPAWLELEITESLLLEDDDVGETLDALNARGISIAIDDFGTGYSALSYFHRFPIHTLKIDRTFIRDIEIDGKKTGIIRAIISIAQALKMRLVAEGVESGHQAEILKSFGCDAVQGYWYGRPMPAADFLQILLASSDAPRRAVS